MWRGLVVERGACITCVFPPEVPDPVVRSLQVSFCMVATPYQWSAFHKCKSSGHSFFPIHRKDIGMDKFSDRMVHRGGLQLLADGEDITSMFTPVVHDLQDFITGFSESDHDAGF